MDAGDRVRFLTWDSDFFNLRIARIQSDRLDAAGLAEIFAWRQAEAVDCLYFLADPNHSESLRLAESHGFRLVDLRLTLEWRAEGQAPEMPPEVRLFQPQDRAALRAIARVSHTDSRFYFDGHFAPEDCDRLYDTWIDKSCDGYADVVLVADVGGQAVGYMTCSRENGEGIIGLVGVHPDYQGRALGKALVHSSLAWFAGQGLNRVSVVTQGRNIRAQRLYQRCGFLSRSVQLWFHWWNESR
ncbi:acetyltransferases [Longilinea arvoryzae]|uniref:Acetyltransferases n=1 Tax=Longilinea arvoryzae TaxID=360412 RepID=A0A0S7BHY5_9CHLR|nr:GNAT family N-acetyltransferase [Longilinea arvoryzae]GAP13457.1 acetyltransferases [Longilinea arvoryzae]